MDFNAQRPYNLLPPLPPASLTEILSSPATQRFLVAAHRSLAELKGRCSALPSADLLLHAVILQEGKDSSEIEQIVTTQDDLYRAVAHPEEEIGAGAAKEVLRYREAVFHGWDGLQRRGLITTNLLVDIVQILKGNDGGVRKHPVSIGGPQSGTVYTPPEGEDRIREHLTRLEMFINEETGDDVANEIDPLVRMALIHYQFEAIHPFYDGNGRTGRILNILYLIDRGLLDSPVLYLSAWILRNRQEYYQRLLGVTARGEWEEWIRYMLDAVRVTASATLRLVENITTIMGETIELAREGMKTGYSRDLIRLIFERPYCTINLVIDEGLVSSRRTAAAYLEDLERLGILSSTKVHRQKYFINVRLMELMREFRV